MTRCFHLLPLLALALLPGNAVAQEVRLGIAAPLSGSRAILGGQMEAGARAAAAQLGGVGLELADTGCTAEGGVDAARLLTELRVDAVVGFVCTAALEAALPLLAQAEIPVLTTGVRANRITDQREKTGFPVWRLAPRSDAEADALADFVRANWRDEPFGIVEDGSAYSRDLADEVRARLGPESIEPALVDNFRPAEDRQFAIGRRILQSGVTRILLFGTRRDVAIIARDAAELGLDLEIVGGEALIDEADADVALPDGIRAVAIFDEGGDYPGEPAAAKPVREGYFGPTYAGVQIAVEALRQAEAQERPFAKIVGGGDFQTVLGPIDFGAKGDSSWDAFDLLVWDGTRFVPAPQS